MTTKVKKWGNSLAFRLPREIVDKFGLFDGSTIDIFARDKNIIVKPVVSVKRSLGDLVDQITVENKHDLVDWAGKKGAEVW
ncbi:MAG: AbrB/MazE/SpoVT family DNA-binding domain-containing protein [Candidatus Vogelbacteria bacterium]|nr:AbrB/MazE/SpoVT family DNA-binding domain-containing protein [Candidatus Vogelbacteria bacterium]